MGVEIISTLYIPDMTQPLLLCNNLIVFWFRIKIISPIVNEQDIHSRLHYKWCNNA
jgi:hypothetical protein